MEKQIEKFRKFYFVIFGCIPGILLAGCALFQSPAERIPSRKAFFATSIAQGSIAELRSSYRQHYKLVSDELKQLETYYNTTQDKQLWLKEKIKEHRNYLNTMEQYSFLCPEHITKIPEKEGTRCTYCKGKGYFLLRTTKCTTCAGTGTVSHRTVKCRQCNQYYRGSILGRTLNENK